jgi:hypothetical protein
MEIWKRRALAKLITTQVTFVHAGTSLLNQTAAKLLSLTDTHLIKRDVSNSELVVDDALGLALESFLHNLQVLHSAGLVTAQEYQQL